MTEMTGEVHPVAALFPMLPEEELRELAEDIKANGLIHPIVLDGEGQLIDGRNRLRACEMAGVEPSFTSLNDHDPVAYILSSNVNRRHMTKGQRAMAVAMAKPEPEKGGRGKQSHLIGEFGKEYLTRARLVVRYGRDDLVPAVLAGTKPLNEAFAEAERRRDAVTSDEARLAHLRAEAPDLADLVAEERLTLAGALAELAERTRQHKQNVTITSERLSKAIKVALETLRDADARAYAIDMFSDAESYLDEPLTRDTIAAAAQNLTDLAKEWPR